jgi:hypothetical protein
MGSTVFNIDIIYFKHFDMRCICFDRKKTLKEFYDFLKNTILLCKIMRSRSYCEFYVYIQFSVSIFVIIST